MPDAAEMVRTLYEQLGKWRLVADAGNGDTADYSKTWYWRVSRGEIEPEGDALVCIQRIGRLVTERYQAKAAFRWWEGVEHRGDAAAAHSGDIWPRSRPGGNLPAIARAARLAAAELEER